MTLSIAAEPIPLEMDESGTVRVGGTRLTLETVLDLFERGDSPDEIAAAFHGLERADVYAIITYYPRHRDEVEQYLREQEARAAENRREFEALQGDQSNLRAKLLARRAQQQSH
jgi:uncharacterized protein (DUF433 family)